MANLPRTLLFTPGSRPERFMKAAASDAEAIILDLEDAVAEESKEDSRRHVVQFLESRPDIRQRIVVRVNSIDGLLGLEDIIALSRIRDAADFSILVPKAEQPAELAALARVLQNAASEIRLGCLVESALGVAQAVNLAGASGLLDFMMFGAADYAADLGQEVDTYRPDYARAALVNAAAARGIVAIDSPFFAIDRPDLLRDTCDQGKAMGFYGMAAIHPAQLSTIALAYTPSDAELGRASRILEAAPNGVGVLDGKMVDIAMVRWARRII